MDCSLRNWHRMIPERLLYNRVISLYINFLDPLPCNQKRQPETEKESQSGQKRSRSWQHGMPEGLLWSEKRNESRKKSVSLKPVRPTRKNIDIVARIIGGRLSILAGLPPVFFHWKNAFHEKPQRSYGTLSPHMV